MPLPKQQDAIVAGLMRDVKDLQKRLDDALARIDALEKPREPKKV